MKYKYKNNSLCLILPIKMSIKTSQTRSLIRCMLPSHWVCKFCLPCLSSSFSLHLPWELVHCSKLNALFLRHDCSASNSQSDPQVERRPHPCWGHKLRTHPSSCRWEEKVAPRRCRRSNLCHCLSYAPPWAVQQKPEMASGMQKGLVEHSLKISQATMHRKKQWWQYSSLLNRPFWKMLHGVAP